MENCSAKRRAITFRLLFERCSKGMTHLTELLLFAVMIIITYEVVARYIFKRPTIWAIDISRYCLVYITFLVATALLLRGEHINIDLLITRLGQRARVIFQIISHLLSAAAFGFLCYYTSLTCLDHYRRGILVIDPIEIPKVIPLAIIPIGSLFLFVGALLKVVDLYVEWKSLREKEGRP